MRMPVLLLGFVASLSCLSRGQEALFTFTGRVAVDHFGWSVSSADDVNRDGTVDFLIGSPRDDRNGSRAGVGNVYSGRNGALLYSFTGDTVGDELGFSVRDAGDVNQDGWPDLVAGGPFADVNGYHGGVVRVFSGHDGSLLL